MDAFHMCKDRDMSTAHPSKNIIQINILLTNSYSASKGNAYQGWSKCIKTWKSLFNFVASHPPIE